MILKFFKLNILFFTSKSIFPTINLTTHVIRIYVHIGTYLLLFIILNILLCCLVCLQSTSIEPGGRTVDLNNNDKKNFLIRVLQNILNKTHNTKLQQ